MNIAAAETKRFDFVVKNIIHTSENDSYYQFGDGTREGIGNRFTEGSGGASYIDWKIVNSKVEFLLL